MIVAHQTKNDSVEFVLTQRTENKVGENESARHMQIMYLALPYFLAVALSASLTAEDGSEILEEKLFGSLHIG